MDDLAGRIANAFGGRLVIDREMGGGGMSRVFLATESRIGRRVVIKVLLPELSADVSAERFRREIEIAARLQHPHVVPLLEVGGGDDVVCFSMPYVEGESLRVRLERERALPVSDAVRLWREMLDALSYAHAHGVVHRDIKPENVLLSGKHAMVTDFGVAKALGQATGGDRITGTGVSLGTPAYMSPEQAAGDRQLDHRSDLYSAGLVMWEMLAGHHPFAGLAPHQMLSAQAVRWVPSVIDERPALAGPLATLVAQCLAKNPADRPTSADAVLAALEAIPITDPGRTIDTPTPSARTPRKPSGRSWRARVLTALSVVVIIGYLSFRAVTGASPPLSRAASAALRPEEATADSIARRADAVFRMVAVLTTPGEASDTALRYQAEEIVGSVLRADSMLMVPSRRQLTGLMRNARIPERFINDPDTLDAVVHASTHAIVRIGLARFGSSFDVSASVTRTDLGSEVARFTADAHDSASLPRALRIVADSARIAIRRVAPQLQMTGDGRFASPTSVRLVSDAIARNSTRDYLGAVELARAATRADSNNVDAWRALGAYLENARMNRAEMLDAMARAYRLKDRTTELSAAVITRDYFKSTEQLSLAVAAVDSLNALTNRLSIPRLAPVENDAGLVRGRQREYALAERHFRQAIEASRNRRPGFAYSNLVAMLLAQGKRDAADSLIRIIEARDTTGIFTRRAREFRAMMSHDYDAVITLSRADLAATNRPEFSRAFSLFRLGAALALTGRQRSADSAAAAGEELMARLGDPGLAFRSAVTRAVQLLVLTGDSATAHRIVSEAERRYAPASLRFLDRRHAQHARALAALGDTAGAARILSQWQREVPREFSRVDARAVMNARGQLALDERRPNEALSLFRNREFGFCECDQVNVARAFDALRQADSAIVYYEKYLGTPASDDLGLDLQWRPFVFRRLGELYEQQGQRTKALDSYEAFVALWKNAEPEQQRVVTEVKERIAKLRRATG